MRTVFRLQFILNCSSSNPQVVLLFGLVFVTDFTSYSVFSISQIHEVRTGSSPRTSQGRSRPTSLNLSVFIFWGFISLICVGDLHCFNSFIICKWLAISSGYISSVNWGQLNPIRLVEKPAL